MTPEQIVVWIIVGGLAGFLANLIMPRVEFWLLEAIIVGILGAFGGGWLLGVLGIFLGAGIVGTFLSGSLGAILSLAILVGVRVRSHGSQAIRQRQPWSFVQPFEE